MSLPIGSSCSARLPPPTDIISSALLLWQIHSLSCHSGMGDSLRQKAESQALSCRANNNQNKCYHKMSEISQPGPTSRCRSQPLQAWSWLESKGWMLNSKDNSSSKLSDILLSATLSFRVAGWFQHCHPCSCIYSLCLYWHKYHVYRFQSRHQ